MAKTNFEKVMEFNRAFDMVKSPKTYISCSIDELGIPQGNVFTHFRPNLFKDEPKTIKLRLDLIKEEIEELNEAVKNNDFIETRDAIGDILYVVYGMADVLGINIDYHFKRDVNEKHIIHDATELVNRISLYSNNDDTKKPIGLTNFGWIKLYLNVVQESFSDKQDCPKKCLDKCLKLINNTYLDIEKFCNNHQNHKDTELCNIANFIIELLSYVYIYAVLNNIDADADFTIIHDSNMSKLCDSEEDAILTVTDYEEKFKNGKSPYDSPYYYYLEDLNKWIIKNKSTGKALKNIKYKQVAFN
jgi:predicted HAD superfamily Cof-like phosphohydrolase